VGAERCRKRACFSVICERFDAGAGGSYVQEAAVKPSQDLRATSVLFKGALGNPGMASLTVARGRIVARSLNWHVEGTSTYLAGYWVRFPEDKRPIPGDSGSPVWNKRTGASIGLVSFGRPLGSFEETLVVPLLHPPNMPANRVPGILHHHGMAPLQLKLGG
jgi:hypothetical protein